MNFHKEKCEIRVNFDQNSWFFFTFFRQPIFVRRFSSWPRVEWPKLPPAPPPAPPFFPPPKTKFLKWKKLTFEWFFDENHQFRCHFLGFGTKIRISRGTRKFSWGIFSATSAVHFTTTGTWFRHRCNVTLQNNFSKIVVRLDFKPETKCI